MKRSRAIVLALTALLLVVAACGGTNAGSTSSRPKVGFIWVDPVNGSGWTLQWDRARQDLGRSLGVQTVAVGPVAEGPDVVPVYEDLIRQGCKVIFGTAFGYQPFTTQEAKKHPDVKFIGIGPNTQPHLPNVATVYGNLWEARYVTGVAAGLMTKTNRIGFVAAHTIPSVAAGINGFALGVQSVNPSAVVKVAVTNSWYDPPSETQAAQSLIQSGADVTAQHEDSTATLLASAKDGVWSIGSEADTHDIAPRYYLTGTYYNWSQYVREQVQAIESGTWKPEDYSGDLESGLITIGPINPAVPRADRTRIEQALSDLKSGRRKVFTGPISSNTGELKIPAGTVWSTSDIYTKTNFFVKGVQGQIQS